MKYLFFRGFWDKNNEANLNDNTDVWVELFKEIAKGSRYQIVYLNKSGTIAKIVGNSSFSIESADVIFCRGAYAQYHNYLLLANNAIKVRYGAGSRFIPSRKYSNYDLCLVDNVSQVKRLKSIYSNMRCEILTKPAASCFKKLDEKKEYDCCFIANWQQKFKGHEWLYRTVPDDLTILHLGNGEPLYARDNVIPLGLSRREMPLWINRCKVGVLPYFNNTKDSAPRAHVEMVSCGLPVVCADSLMVNDRIDCIFSNEENFWPIVKAVVDGCKPAKSVSLKDSALKIKNLISGIR